MLYRDINYLEKISPYLERFQKKSDNLWACRCVYCGDSKKSKSITRGYFYVGTENNIMFSCRNCDVTVPFGAFLKEQFNQYYVQYRLDGLRKDDTLKFAAPTKKVSKNFAGFSSLKPEITYSVVSELEENHPAKIYLAGRKIEHMDRFGYTKNFRKYVQSLDCNPKYDKLPEDERIIIPITDEGGNMMGFQGRYMGTDESVIRYITIKLNPDYFVKLYGLSRYDKDSPGFIIEGPFDSEFLTNTLAMCGSSLDTKAVKEGHVIPENVIIAYDNEPRNLQIVKNMYSASEVGFRVYVPPKGLNTKLKDVSDMIKAGWSKREIMQLLIKNSYQGVRAEFAITNWKKV